MKILKSKPTGISRKGAVDFQVSRFGFNKVRVEARLVMKSSPWAAD